MGGLSKIFNSVSGAMDQLGSKIPSLNIDQSLFGESLQVLKPYLEGANKIFPIKETLSVLGILCAFAVAFFIFWTVQRLINLVRGAG